MLINLTWEGEARCWSVCSICGDRFLIYKDWLDAARSKLVGRGILLPVCGYCWKRQGGHPAAVMSNPLVIPFTEDPWVGGVIFYRTEGL